MKRLVGTGFFLCLLAGCGSQSDGPSAPVIREVTFAKVWKEVLEPQCRSCHGKAGAFDVDNYARIKGQLEDLKTQVFTAKKMPPQVKLTAAQSDLLKRWIEASAPLGQAPTFPTMAPSVTLAPTWRSIRENILVPKCQVCHSAVGRVARIPLESPADLLKAIGEPPPPGGPVSPVLVQSGAPDQSRFYLSIVRTDRRRMPPAKSKIASLSPEEITTVRNWIENGLLP